MTARTPLRALVVEDSADDAELIMLQLQRDGFEVSAERVEEALAMTRALSSGDWDLVLSDHAMPEFSAMGALELLHDMELDLPCVVVSGAIGEEAAVALMQAGAVDYVNKSKLGQLGPAVRRALRETELRRARQEAEEGLKRAHGELARRLAELERAKTELEQAKTELETANEKLLHDAFHDSLTGLPNRALFTDRLEHAIERRERDASHSFAVLFVDFDRFKVINDSMGHTTGDALLVAISERMKRCLRPSDTVARLGGDEFTVLLEDFGRNEDIFRTVERIQEELARPYHLDGQTLHISASIGVVVCGRYGDCPEDILRAADIAMYRAKALGKAHYQVFDRSMYDRAMLLMELEHDLRGAVERRELQVYYHPIVAMGDGRISGFEALVRWRHPRLGTISPAEFVPLAEETGLIVDIDRWVLREACRQLESWRSTYPDTRLTLSVNLSGRQLQASDLDRQVRDILHETGFDPCNLRLEITEGTLMHDSKSVSVMLGRLKALGLKLHIDDFGTGYSSLSYLQRFPMDALKIDRSFIDHMVESNEGAELVRTITVMAKNLQVQVVAEGVETAEQLEQLRTLECDYVQGFYFSKPLDSAGATSLIAEVTS